MRQLTLRIKRPFFDAILKGEKKTETREVTRNTASRLIYFSHRGKNYKKQKDIPNDEASIYINPIRYDQLQLINGYHKDAPRLVVEVKDATFYFIEDESGNNLTYEDNGKEYYASIVEYALGKILSTANI